MRRGIDGKRVLDGGVLRVELAGEVGLGDQGVVRREMVALVAEGADPDLGVEVDAREGVEDGGAGLAPQRRVGERGDVRVAPDRSDAGGEWDHALAGLDLGAWPDIPRHAHSVDPFGVCVGHLRHCYLNSRGFSGFDRIGIEGFSGFFFLFFFLG